MENANTTVQKDSSETPETARLIEEGQAQLVKSSQPLLATSGNKETQKIIDRLTAGEDFETHKWRCFFNPDMAYYSLSPFARLTVEMVEARNLIPSVTSSFESYLGDEPDGFVKVYVDDCFKYSTSCINNDRNPQWNDTQVFDIVADKSIVRLHVYDSDSHDNSTLIDPIGFVEFCIADIPFDQVIDGWLELRFPGNLQGINTDRYAEHMAQREEEMQTPMPTKPSIEQDDSNNPAPKAKSKKKEAADPADAYKVEAAKIKTSFTNRMFKRIRAGSNKMMGRVEEPPPDTQFNAGEIHVRMKLERCVSENTALFAKALVPSCMTFATFIQEEFLPKLDVQELLDDALDLKIEIVDEMFFAVAAFFSYVLAWRSIMVSGLLFICVMSGAKSSMLVYGFWHLWLALVLVLLKFDSWRLPMTTNGYNAPLNQEGLQLIAQCRDVNEMYYYLIRMVQSRMGVINSMQELVHFAGTIVQGDGELTVTFDQLMKALRDLWFLDFASGSNHLEVDTLVRVHDRRRGTVTKIHVDKTKPEGNPHRQKIEVDFDEKDFQDPSMKGTFDAWDVSVRPSVPSIPRFLVPKTILSLVSTLQFEADAAKKAILPYAEGLRAFFRWKKPKWMALVLLVLLFRAYISFEGFLDEHSWCHIAIRVMTILRNVLLGVLVLFVLFGQAKIWKVGRGLILLAVSKTCESRQAPDCWKFYKPPNVPYRVTEKPKAE